MIHAFDTADQAVEKTINSLCKDLESVQPDAPEFMQIVDAISKLRASLNPTIIQKSE
jgi:hypothetical protein